MKFKDLRALSIVCVQQIKTVLTWMSTGSMEGNSENTTILQSFEIFSPFLTGGMAGKVIPPFANVGRGRSSRVKKYCARRAAISSFVDLILAHCSRLVILGSGAFGLEVAKTNERRYSM